MVCRGASRCRRRRWPRHFLPRRLLRRRGRPPCAASRRRSLLRVVVLRPWRRGVDGWRSWRGRVLVVARVAVILRGLHSNKCVGIMGGFGVRSPPDIPLLSFATGKYARYSEKTKTSALEIRKTLASKQSSVAPVFSAKTRPPIQTTHLQCVNLYKTRRERPPSLPSSQTYEKLAQLVWSSSSRRRASLSTTFARAASSRTARTTGRRSSSRRSRASSRASAAATA